MEIKQKQQLLEGTVIEYKHRAEAMGVTDLTERGNKARFKTELLQVVKCYKNHVLFRQVNPPHLKVSLTNNELYQMGIYTECDFVKRFIK